MFLIGYITGFSVGFYTGSIIASVFLICICFSFFNREEMSNHIIQAKTYAMLAIIFVETCYILSKGF